MIVLPFDAETTGIFHWKIPSDDPSQPHIVQLGAALFDEEAGEEKEHMNVIVRPDGWEITQETIDIHGITMEQAMDEGINEADALEEFMSLYRRCDRRTAHNTTFDNRAIRVAMKRYWDDSDESVEAMRSWKDDKGLYYCTMREAQKKLGGKWPKLAELYERLTGKVLENAHDALVDARACCEVYQKLQELE